ncbi:MAG TPA: hypothetical protein PKO06_01610, partial [Candidatus Ozemobacteraceae bacterium]|nr:hypothetical protein [Candidatus Ozemobacteraceae bacterium]
MTFHGSPLSNRFLRARIRAGFILPVAMLLISILMILGWMFLSTTMHSKNISNVFYRDDMARLVAESAAAELRVRFAELLEKNAALQAMCSNPTGPGSTMTLSQSEFPQTTALADTLAGSGQIDFSCMLSTTHVDTDLKEGAVAVRFDGEYQATLQMTFTVALGTGTKQRNSQFVYEHDLKRVNFRSSSVGRTGRGYTSTMANDYVLYVRNALGEFDKFNGLSLNNNERGLAVLQPEAGKKGRLFFGTARPTDSQQEKKYVFINIDKSLEALIPPAPPVTGVSWSDMQSQMPIFAGKIQAVIDEAKSKSEGKINFYPDRIKSELSVEYKPIVKENNIWWQSLWNKIKEVFNSFIAKVTGKQKNVDKGIGLLGENNSDFSICSLIDGNLRQRFW